MQINLKLGTRTNINQIQSKLQTIFRFALDIKNIDQHNVEKKSSQNTWHLNYDANDPSNMVNPRNYLFYVNCEVLQHRLLDTVYSNLRIISKDYTQKYGVDNTYICSSCQASLGRIFLYIATKLSWNIWQIDVKMHSFIATWKRGLHGLKISKKLCAV